MGYVRKVLLPGETVVYETGLHWLVYGKATLLLALAVALALGSAFVGPDQANFLLIPAAAVAILGIIMFIIAAIRRASTELAVTDQRVIFKTGVIARHTLEMNRSKVESVDVDQSIPGRLFGFGTVTIRGTGGGIEPMRNIADPIAFRNHVTAT